MLFGGAQRQHGHGASCIERQQVLAGEVSPAV